MFFLFRSALRQSASSTSRRLIVKPRHTFSTTTITRLHDMATDNAKFGTNRLFNVEGWVVVVTGGGTGIGLMIAQALANNGARVYITGRRPEALETVVKTWGKNLTHPRGQVIPVSVDITDKASIEKLVKEISQNEKHVDVLVNNAGISKGTSIVEKGDESAKALKEQLWNEELSDWEEVYRTNVIGRVAHHCFFTLSLTNVHISRYFFTSAAFLPLLAAAAREGHTGTVINVSSMSGITRTSQHHFKYNVSKAAAIHLSQLLAQEFRRPGVKVRVNNIAPGIFPSEMTGALHPLSHRACMLERTCAQWESPTKRISRRWRYLLITARRRVSLLGAPDEKRTWLRQHFSLRVMSTRTVRCVGDVDMLFEVRY